MGPLTREAVDLVALRLRQARRLMWARTAAEAQAVLDELRNDTTDVAEVFQSAQEAWMLGTEEPPTLDLRLRVIHQVDQIAAIFEDAQFVNTHGHEAWQATR